MEQGFENLFNEEIVKPAPENRAFLKYIQDLAKARRLHAESVAASAGSTSELLKKIGARTITLFLNPGTTYMPNTSEDSTPIAARALITGSLPDVATDDVRNGVQGVARDLYKWFNELQYRIAGRITHDIGTDLEPTANMSLNCQDDFNISQVSIGAVRYQNTDSQSGIEVLLFQPSTNTPFGVAAIINDPASFEGWVQRFGTVQQAPENPQIKKVDIS